MNRNGSSSQLYGEMSRDESEMRDSRAGSADSEEAALYNGRKTLAEVAAKLNDVEGIEKEGVGEGKRGLISVDRFPFLSNLFNYRSTNNGIVVDEEDANQEDNPIADIFLWRFPLVSVIWFCIVQVVFFLVVFCDFSLLTIAAVLFSWQLVVDFVITQVYPKAQQMGLLSDEVDIHETLRKNTFFNARLIKRVGAASYEIADVMIGMWRVTVLEANMSRILVVGRFVIIVFLRSFSVGTSIWLMLMILFTIPVSYSKNRYFADAVADGAQVAATKRFRRLRALSRNVVDLVEARAQAESAKINVGPISGRPTRVMVANVWRLLLLTATNVNWFLDKLIG